MPPTASAPGPGGRRHDRPPRLDPVAGAPGGSGPLYLKLRQTLEEAISSGRLNHGDALPPERDLAEYANISRVTVRKAVDDLVKDGLLVRRHGSGTFVV